MAFEILADTASNFLKDFHIRIKLMEWWTIIWVVAMCIDLKCFYITNLSKKHVAFTRRIPISRLHFYLLCNYIVQFSKKVKFKIKHLRYKKGAAKYKSSLVEKQEPCLNLPKAGGLGHSFQFHIFFNKAILVLKRSFYAWVCWFSCI